MVQQMADSRTVIPVGACIEASGYDTSAFLPGALDAYETEGVQWSMPFNVSTPVLFFNKVMFEDRRPRSRRPAASRSRSCERPRRRSSTPAPRPTASPSTRASTQAAAWFLEQWFAKAGQPYADNGNGRLAPATRVLFNGPDGCRAVDRGARPDRRRAGRDGRRQPPAGGQLLKLADQAQPAAMAIASSRRSAL